MILDERFKQNEVIQEGNDETMHMEIDTESVGHLMMILSTNLYQDPIGSIVREYTSNALDSNVEAESTEPIIVSLENNNQNQLEFTVEDFGMGLDEDDFKKTIKKFGKSTKQQKANQLGYYGQRN